jgi:murein DD-endopeptidase MepM/ murein hydrolase activator NlpD
MMADRGQDVHTVADGTVAFAGTARGFGTLVIVDHGRGYRTYYAHLAATAKGLHAGDVLLRGDVLGLVGSTGHSTGPHLHFETRLGNDYIDPRDASHQLEFWILSAAEQAWVARQMLAFAPPVLPANASMVVGTDGSVARHAGLSVEDSAVCRAYAQVLSPERPELPKPVVRKAVRKKAKKPAAKAHGR